MKKILYFAIMLVTVCGFCACSGDSPSDVVEDSFDCLKKGDFKGYFSSIYSPYLGKDAEEEEKNFEDLWNMAVKEGNIDKMKEKWESEEEKWRSMKVKILSEEIEENGEKAVVKVNIKTDDIDNDGDIELRKDASGKWKIVEKRDWR